MAVSHQLLCQGISELYRGQKREKLSLRIRMFVLRWGAFYRGRFFQDWTWWTLGTVWTLRFAPITFFTKEKTISREFILPSSISARGTLHCSQLLQNNCLGINRIHFLTVSEFASFPDCSKLWIVYFNIIAISIIMVILIIMIIINMIIIIIVCIYPSDASNTNITDRAL